MIILDTNVLSELMRPNPSATVVRWIACQTATDLCTTAVTQAEILYGLASLPEGKRRSDLLTTAGQMFTEDFAGRVLPFDGAAAEAFALLAAGRRRAGRPTGTFGAQIAGFARSRGAAVATRNVADFQDCGVVVINPWDE